MGNVGDLPMKEWVAGDGILEADKIRVGVARTEEGEDAPPTDVSVYLAREIAPGIEMSLVARLPLEQAESTYLALGECIKAVREKRLPDIPLLP